MAGRGCVHLLLDEGQRVSQRLLLALRVPCSESFAKHAYLWVPAGLLENGGEVEIVAHLCVASKAPWNSIPLEGLHYDAAPDLAEFVATLSSVKPG